ncbi:MAG TPA: TIGR00730 family Rossman fold protein [Bacteroidales bacterium]|nr:TIGR00730 family Rossman fold protein [Bacteroidales bacterium]HPS50497.1 TIGR00730 family Rossman fold protein [Bacteroidales bacterium]
MIKNLCVFCGSSFGSNPAYAEGAAQLAQILLNKNITLVYGGANVGLMRILADTVLKGGGKVVGVMPRSLVEKEVAHQHLTEMHIVDGMQERKALMADLSDAFIALPGAFGTLDEIFEVLTWNQLGIIHKPLGLFNTGGYFDPLLAMLDRAVEQHFLRPEHRKMVLEFNSVEEIIGQLEAYRPVEAPKWIERLKEGKI